MSEINELQLPQKYSCIMCNSGFVLKVHIQREI